MQQLGNLASEPSSLLEGDFARVRMFICFVMQWGCEQTAAGRKMTKAHAEFAFAHYPLLANRRNAMINVHTEDDLQAAADAQAAADGPAAVEGPTQQCVKAQVGGPVCPGCGKTLPLRATICLDCNLNVASGRPLPAPIAPAGSTSSIWVVFGLVLVLCAFVYANLTAIREMVSGSTLQAAPAVPFDTNEPPAAAPAMPETSALVFAPVAESITEETTTLRNAVTTRSAGVEPTRTRAKKAAAPPSTPAAPLYEISNVRCDLCRGTGRIRREGSVRTTYRCPVCHGVGGRERRLRAGQRLCGDCRGMGQIGRMGDLFRTRNYYVSDRCKTCRGTGVLRD